MSEKPMLAALRPFEGMMADLDCIVSLIADLSNCGSEIAPNSLNPVATVLGRLAKQFEDAHASAWTVALALSNAEPGAGA